MLRVVVGPTGSGKTRAAVEVARRLGGVVLSADARQVYRGLDVASAKEGEPAAHALAGLGDVPARVVDGVPQIGLDLVTPDVRYTAAKWHAFAARAMEALVDAKTPVVVAGGTGLYVEALLRDFDWPDTDPALRESVGGATRRETRRREIEALGQRPRARGARWEARVVGIDPPRDAHRAVLEARLRAWLASPALARELDALPADAEARTAIGYAEAEALRRGQIDFDGAVARAFYRTWTYARRQRAYFRNRLPETAWVATAEDAVRALLAPA